MDQSWRRRALAAALCVIGALPTACGGSANETPRQPAQVAVEGGVQVVTNTHPVWEAGGGWQLSPGPLVIVGVDEGTPGEMFANPASAAPLSDGTIVVVDSGSKELRFFAPDGKYLRSAGGPGEGPCEFDEIGPAYLADDGSIVVADWSARRFAVFASDGTCLGNQTLRFQDYRILEIVGRHGSGEVVLLGSKRSPDSSSAAVRWQMGTLVTLTLGAASLSPLRDVRRFEWNGRFENLEFASWAYVTTRGNSIFYTDGDTYEIAVYDREGSPVQRMLRSGLPSAVTPADIALRRDFITEWQTQYGRAEVARQIADEHAFAPRFPAYEQLLVDAERNVWALRAEDVAGSFRQAPRYNMAIPAGIELPATRLWDVYDPQGRWLGVVHVPADRYPSYVGLDRIFLLGMDELGVERLWIHAILKSAAR